MPSAIPVSELPKAVQDIATHIDLDQDGAIGTNDFSHAIAQMDNAKNTNKLLRRVTKYFAIVSVMLVFCVFGSTIAAARLAKDVELDPETGFAFVRGSHHSAIMKTQEALVWRNDNIVDATSDQLAYLKDVILNDGDIRFSVKGTARVADSNDVILLVEGGTLHFSEEGLVGAEGDAMALIKASIGDDFSYGDGREEERRMLRCACSVSMYAYLYV